MTAVLANTFAGEILVRLNGSDPVSMATFEVPVIYGLRTEDDGSIAMVPSPNHSGLNAELAAAFRRAAFELDGKLYPEAWAGPCPDCDRTTNQGHEPGCDRERCLHGNQSIACEECAP